MKSQTLHPSTSMSARTVPVIIPSNIARSSTCPNKQSRVTYLRFPSLMKQKGLHHGVFTRHGGVSAAPYNSLNTSHKTGDRKEHVALNLEMIRTSIGADRLALVNQVHGRDILILERKDLYKGDGRIRADALITDVAGLALTVRQADCQGIILFDEKKKVVALVHCGWRGSVANILASTVEMMIKQYRCNPSHLAVAIGPSLGPCCAEFRGYEALFPDSFSQFKVGPNHFDLWKISQWQLSAAGIDEGNIEVAGICTKCSHEFFFSHRAEGITGRFATVAMLIS